MQIWAKILTLSIFQLEPVKKKFFVFFFTFFHFFAKQLYTIIENMSVCLSVCLFQSYSPTRPYFQLLNSGSQPKKLCRFGQKYSHFRLLNLNRSKKNRFFSLFSLFCQTNRKILERFLQNFANKQENFRKLISMNVLYLTPRTRADKAPSILKIKKSSILAISIDFYRSCHF